MKTPVKTALLTALLAIPSSLLAAPPGGGPPRPPVQAIEACEELVEQDPCSFTLDEQTVVGTCMAGPRPELLLACRPDRDSEERGRRGPPPEALEVCVYLEINEVCTFTHDGRDLTGTCVSGRDPDGSLVCRPDAPPPR